MVPINEAWNALKVLSKPASLLDLTTASIVSLLLRLRKSILVVSIEHRALMGTNCIEGPELIVHALSMSRATPCILRMHAKQRKKIENLRFSAFWSYLITFCAAPQI